MPPPANKTKPAPNKNKLVHLRQLSQTTQLHSELMLFPSWRAEHPDPTIQQQLQDAEDQHKFLVPGISNNPDSYHIYEAILGNNKLPSKWFPMMYPGGVPRGVVNVGAAILGVSTAENGLSDVTGRIELILAYSGGTQTVVSSGLRGTLKAHRVHLFAPVLLSGDLQSITSFDHIYIHRGQRGIVGWLSFLELRLENIPDGGGGQMPGFTITIHRDGPDGRVTRDSWDYDHTGSNGFREHIDYILKNPKQFPP